MQSPTTARKALFDADLEQALSLLDRQQAKLSLGTPLSSSGHYSIARKSTSYSESPSCLYKSHSMDSGLSSISHTSRISGAPETSNLSFNVQIPVKHFSTAGTQAGTYYPKYQVYKQSKCISCKDCSIFFSPSAFLKHCHNKKLGSRVECNASCIELATDNPGIQQQKLWDEFQCQVNRNGMLSYGDNDRILTPSTSFRNSGENAAADNRFSWRDNGSASGDSLNGSIHNDVLASRRLLQSTQNIIQGSAEKAKRRYNSRNDIMSSVSNLTNGSLEIDAAKQPVIKTSSSIGAQPSARKSLQKYLSDEKDFRLGSLKFSDSASTSDNRLLNSSVDGNHGDVINEKKQGSESVATPEQKLLFSCYSGDDSKSEDANKEDPVKILQNAQELIQLASAKLQRQQSQSVIDWEERYQAEKKLRRKVEQKLNDIQGQLHLEQQRRQEIEIELRALKLQL